MLFFYTHIHVQLLNSYMKIKAKFYYKKWREEVFIDFYTAFFALLHE